MQLFGSFTLLSAEQLRFHNAKRATLSRVYPPDKTPLPFMFRIIAIGLSLVNTSLKILQVCISHQGAIHGFRCLSSFPDGPYNQGLTAVHITGCENTRDAGFVLVRFSQDIGSRVQVGLESVGNVFLASPENRLRSVPAAHL